MPVWAALSLWARCDQGVVLQMLSWVALLMSQRAWRRVHVGGYSGSV